MSVFNPDAMGADATRKLTILLNGDPETVQLLIQQWADRPGFRKEWALSEMTSRAASDLCDAACAAIKSFKES